MICRGGRSGVRHLAFELSLCKKISDTRGVTMARDIFSTLSPTRLCKAIGLCLSIALAGAAFTWNAAAEAIDDAAAMRFLVVRGSQAGCEPSCAEWILAEGAIVSKTPAQFQGFLKALGGRKLPIIVTSPGGDVNAAMALGRMIRKNKLNTAVGMTRFLGCQPEVKDCHLNDDKGAHYLGTVYAGGAFCNSACPLMLAGGTRRLVGQWAFLGVHQVRMTFEKTQVTYRTKYRTVKGKKKILEKKVIGRKKVGGFTSNEMNQEIERKLAAYLKEMGVDQSILTLMKSTPVSDIHRIALVDLLGAHLVTSLDAADLVTSSQICKAVPAAANCRLFTVADAGQ